MDSKTFLEISLTFLISLFISYFNPLYLHIHFVCDKLCAFCAIFFSFRFTIGLNTFIVSRLEFLGYNRIAGGFFVSHLTERDRLKVT